MKQLLLVIFALISINTMSQNEYDYNTSANHNYDFSGFKMAKKTIVDNNIKQIIINTKHKKHNSTYIRQYTKTGLISKKEMINKGGDTITTASYTYNDTDKLTSYNHYRKGKLRKSYIYKYNDNNKLIASYTQKAEHEKVKKTDRTYNDNNCLKESHRYKRNEKIKYTWKYEYYDKCNKSKSTVYNRKGKVINIWTYDCKDAGEKLEKKKDEIQVCKWDSISNNYLYKVKESFNEKGEIVRTVRKYTLDSLILETSLFNKNGKLIYKAIYNKSISRPLTITAYAKGKIFYQYEYKYIDNKQVYWSYTYKNRKKYEVEKNYNGDLLVELKNYNKKGKKETTSKLNYNKYL